jgi:hypothetical protein
MSTLTIFRGSFVHQIRGSIASNAAKYSDDEPWVVRIGSRDSRDLPSRVEVVGTLALDDPRDGDRRDLENAIRVHKALRNLTPLQARDPRVWTRMAHVDFWPYMRKRWPIERFGSDSAKAARFIEARYFVAQSQGRALLRNGIARLWWTAHLSHDPERAKPYELTGVLLSTLDITQQILERNMGRAPTVLAGFLEFLQDNRKLLLARKDENRHRIRKLAKHLNLCGGVSILDCLSQAEIIKLLNAELKRILAAEKGSRKT